jgi:hypothetical protein
MKLLHFGIYINLQGEYYIPFPFPHCENHTVLRDSHIHTTYPGMKLTLFNYLHFTEAYINLEKFFIRQPNLMSNLYLNLTGWRGA